MILGANDRVPRGTDRVADRARETLIPAFFETCS